MRNGEYESTYQKEVVNQLKLINALLLDHADHAIAMRAMLVALMIYMPACSVDQHHVKEVLDAIQHTCVKEDERLRRRMRKTLRALT
jgi:hypothetical protein